MKKILFADDDPEIREVVRILLTREGYEVVEAVNGIEAVEKADHTIDLIILDVMMPGCSGVEACGEIRKKSSAPILFLTAKSKDRDKEEGFAAGGDDYLVKPYAVGELLARIRAVTRRPGNFHAGAEKCFADIRLDADRRELSGPGGTVRLSKRETALMEYLIRGAGQILPREIILTYIWGVDAEVEDGNLDNYIYFLRRRLRSVGASAQIVTIHGTGYQLKERQT